MEHVEKREHGVEDEKEVGLAVKMGQVDTPGGAVDHSCREYVQPKVEPIR